MIKQISENRSKDVKCSSYECESLPLLYAALDTHDDLVYLVLRNACKCFFNLN
jgi:hypothetical protein